jgi:hypothetical protein
MSNTSPIKFLYFLPNPIIDYYFYIKGDWSEIDMYCPAEMKDILEINRTKELENILRSLRSGERTPEHISPFLLNDLDFCLKMVRTRGLLLKYVSDDLKENRQLIIEATRENYEAFQFAPSTIKNNVVFVRLCLGPAGKCSENLIEFLSEDLRKNEDIILLAINRNPKLFKYASQTLLSNRDFLLTKILNKYGALLEYVSEDLKNDKELTTIAILNDSFAFNYISNKLKKDDLFMNDLFTNINNDDIIKNIISNDENEDSFKYAPSTIKSDIKFILELIKRGNHRCIEFVPDKIKSDKDFFMKVLTYYPIYYKELEKNNFYGLYSDDIQKAAESCILINSDVIQYLKDDLLSNGDFILRFATKKHNYSSFNEIMNAARDKLVIDEAFVLKLVKINPTSLLHNPMFEKILNNKDTIKKIMNINPIYLCFASDNIKSDREIFFLCMKIANERNLKIDASLSFKESNLKNIDRIQAKYLVSNNGYNLDYLPELYKKDSDIIISAIDNDPTSIVFVDEKLITDYLLYKVYINGVDIFKLWNKMPTSNPIPLDLNNKITFRTFFGADPLIYKYLPKKSEFYNDIDVVKDAISRNPKLLEYVPNFAKDDDDIVRIAVLKNGYLIRYASERLRNDFNMAVSAINQSLDALNYISAELKLNKSFALIALGINGSHLSYFHRTLWEDVDIISLAVKTHGLALEYASLELKSDRNIVCSAVEQDGRALQYAIRELRADRFLALAAVKSKNLKYPEYSGSGIRFVDEELLREDLNDQMLKHPKNEESIIFEGLYPNYNYINSKEFSLKGESNMLNIFDYGLDYWYKRYIPNKEFYKGLIGFINRIFENPDPILEKNTIILINKISRVSTYIETYSQIFKSDKTKNIYFYFEGGGGEEEEEEEKEKKRQLKEKKELEFESSYIESIYLLGGFNLDYSVDKALDLKFSNVLKEIKNK